MTIKEFAKLCKCNTQTLRYYDKINLLKPINVNVETGYRNYAKEQALDFVKIKNLQLASFSLEEIRNLLTAEPTTVYDAFSAKINQQKETLQKLKKIQESYRTEYMQAKKLLDELKAKIENSMVEYNHREEFGLSEEEFEAITQRATDCYDNVCLEKSALLEELDKIVGSETTAEGMESQPAAEDAEFDDDEYISPKDNPEYECICQKHSWKHAKEFIRDVAVLDNGEYLFYFEMPSGEHSDDFAFCNTVLGIILNANEGKKLLLGCERHHSEDGENHFLLFRRKKCCDD